MENFGAALFRRGACYASLLAILASSSTAQAQGQSQGQGAGTPPHEQILNAVANLQSSVSAIQSALSQLAGAFGVKPKPIVLFHDLSTNSAAPQRLPT